MSGRETIEATGRHLLLKKWVAAVLCHPLSGKMIGLFFRNKIPHRGSRIEVPAGGDPRVNAALFWGTYESAEIRYVRSHLDGSLDVIELGSSLGGVSCEIARKLARDRKLICVEANPRIVPLLEKNIGRNAANKNIRVLHGAINYDGNPTVGLVIGESNLSSHIGSAKATQQVPVLTLSGIVKRESIGDYALVSDIEGAEAELLVRDAAALANCKLLIIELHDINYDGVNYTPESLISLIERNTRMRLLARYGEVCTFIRDRAATH